MPESARSEIQNGAGGDVEEEGLALVGKVGAKLEQLEGQLVVFMTTTAVGMGHYKCGQITEFVSDCEIVVAC